MKLVIREAGACSDVGQLRQSNEDALLLSDPVFAVADGMGGARAGEVASAMAVAALHGFDGGEQQLAQAIEDVNLRIHDASRNDASLLGMGTTITAAMIDGEALVLAHVGDSRAYVLRAGQLRQLTDDHSLVGELIRRGALTPEEAERHPQRSVITRALGADETVDVDVLRVPVETGDLILLCSDGLTGMVGDAELARILRGGGDLNQLAQQLVTAANRAGGEDNITAVLLRIGSRREEDTEPERPPIVILPATALGDDTPQASAADRAAAKGDRGRGRGRVLALIGAVAAIGIVVAVAVAGGLQWAHFIGATPDGRVAIYQGLPFEVTSDVTLYRAVEITDVSTAALSPEQRATLLDQRIGSLGSAEGRITQLTTSSPWLRVPPSAQ
ncbi:MAG: Stp1/IreP family PP2C-type Ser/Thr phosphatase [Gaiellales bacterium]